MENILNFPETTIVNMVVPKKAFYARSSDSSLKEFLTREFERIVWIYKLAPSTLNVLDGVEVHEISVFYCEMKEDQYSINPFCGMDKLLPRHTLFIIHYGDKFDLLMHHKEVRFHHGEEKWSCGVTELKREICFENTTVSIIGQSMDSVYSGLLSQISGLNIKDSTEYQEQAELRKELENKKRQADALLKKIRGEKQFNRQIEMNAEVRELKKKITELTEKLKK